MKTYAAPLALSAGLALGALSPGSARSAAADAPAAFAVPGYELVALQYDFSQLQDRTSSFIRVDCPEGKKVLGGGVELRDAENRVLRGAQVVESSPIGETGWIGAIVPETGAESFPATGTFKVEAICATVAE